MPNTTGRGVNVQPNVSGIRQGYIGSGYGGGRGMGMAYTRWFNRKNEPPTAVTDYTGLTQPNLMDPEQRAYAADRNNSFPSMSRLRSMAAAARGYKGIASPSGAGYGANMTGTNIDLLKLLGMGGL